MTPQLKRFTPLIVLLAIMAAPMSAMAQQPVAPASPPQATYQKNEGFGIGAKVGPLFATLSEANSSDDFANRTGLIGGLFLGGNRHGIVGVGVDLLYARKGAKNPHGTETVDLDYLNVPVYLRINGGSSSTNGVIGYGIVGLDLNFLLKAKGVSINTDDFQRADYGIAFGGGVEITRFIVEARFTKGIASIAKNKNDPELKTQTVAVMFGVRFN